MLKQKIEFNDLDGKPQSGFYYFNLKESELLDWILTSDGDLASLIKNMTEEHDIKKLYGFFKDFVLRTYGVREDDNITFTKSPELTRRFTLTEPFNAMFMGFVKNPDDFVAFMKGVIPMEMLAKVEADLALAEAQSPLPTRAEM